MKPITIALLIIAMLALFAGGFGISRYLSTRSTAAAATDPLPAPCVTVQVTPASDLPKPSEVKANVYNSTKTVGLAKRTAADLEQRGFAIGTIDNDPKGTVVTGVAEIRHGPEGAQAAALMAVYLPGATLVETSAKGATIDVAVGAEFTSVLTTKQAAAAVSSPSPSLSGAGCASPSASKKASASAKSAS